MRAFDIYLKQSELPREAPSALLEMLRGCDTDLRIAYGAGYTADEMTYTHRYIATSGTRGYSKRHPIRLVAVSTFPIGILAMRSFL
jgi:hypothetical protein